MSPSAPAANRIELLHPGELSRYALNDVREIRFVLKQLAARRAMLTAYYGDGNDFIATCVVELSTENDTLYIDVSPDQALNDRILRLGALHCATQLDKVRIQFEVEDLQMSSFEGLPAFRAPLPQSLLRLQRREYYRLTAPAYDKLECTIPLPDGRQTTLRVTDISGGGIGILGPANSDFLQPEAVLADCRLTLPGIPTTTVTIRVCNVFRLTNADGSQGVRVGCQFVDLPPSAANAIQRYILQSERDRKLRED
ncbi:MAG: flagellar brake protein [Candidatus Dactylopiibacterium carminicum]|uniref:Flagellar brake protein YcgR n=1 Tax=Candidatus Dactylopiibacterium carminicum TaxID=857335 RepID=A0A272EVM6_9RHOO|nr:flagellar brake protein [Candidatus Dactylopiibacterium carminicum]KAF7598171.1 flagellar brake protein [Candidatus Dactylopiibacterium carminicum]PAS94106.1 MAG: flagellar brake protein [Candidatus Dactylopiibacterium carminicum]PAS96858.1 MAG: hypothetical protein BSR46_14750 [Candidatus Dactylopiibacterium carminicum]PAS98130.1 MAG: flagellar brake protein [Candidatus Dactylopiibacterium carminicum]